MSWWRSKPLCAICKKEFEASRSDATFCSPNCRKAGSRQKQALDKTYERAHEALRSLEAYIQTDHRLKSDALALIEKLALDSAAMVNENKGQRHIYQAADLSATRNPVTH